MVREFDCVDLAEDLCEARVDLSLAILLINLAHEQEVLPKAARSHAAQSDCAIS